MNNSALSNKSELEPALASSPAQKKKKDRELAKLGMTVSLGVLVVTGLTRSRSSRKLHMLAAGALVGFSAWHHQLYPSSKSSGQGMEGQK